MIVGIQPDNLPLEVEGAEHAVVFKRSAEPFNGAR